MPLPLQLQVFQLDQYRLELYVPQPGEVRRVYQQQKAADAATPFPYWTQVWPAALALAEFLWQHPHYVQGKEVLELAAGLGLPSLVAAQYAKWVCCTDYLPEAVAVMQQSVTYNQLTHVHCQVLNWHHLPPQLKTEVLLLSDINYDPQEFEVLYGVLTRFLAQGTTLLLSTPQRLMAKPFIERLLPWCVRQQQATVLHQEQNVAVTLLVLQSTATST